MSAPTYFRLMAGEHGAASTLEVNGEDISSQVSEVTLIVAVGEATRLTITYPHVEGRVEGFAFLDDGEEE